MEQSNSKGNKGTLIKDVLAVVLILKLVLIFFTFIIHFFESLNPIEKALIKSSIRS